MVTTMRIRTSYVQPRGVKMPDTCNASERYPNRYRKGQSGNRAGPPSRVTKEAHIDKIVESWCRPYGGSAMLPPVNVRLLREAAELTIYRPRRVDARAGHARLISRLIQQAGIASYNDATFEPLPAGDDEPEENALDKVKRAREEATK
jgi:hypothetical protein